MSQKGAATGTFSHKNFEKCHVKMSCVVGPISSQQQEWSQKREGKQILKWAFLETGSLESLAAASDKMGQLEISVSLSLSRRNKLLPLCRISSLFWLEARAHQDDSSSLSLWAKDRRTNTRDFFCGDNIHTLCSLYCSTVFFASR